MAEQLKGHVNAVKEKHDYFDAGACSHIGM